MAARLAGECCPGEVSHLLQEVTVLLQLLQALTRRLVGEVGAAHPVKVTSNSPGYKLQHALSQAEPLVLLTRSLRSVEDSPLDQLKLSDKESLHLDVNSLGLTHSAHVRFGPELAFLVQVNLTEGVKCKEKGKVWYLNRPEEG